MLTMTTGEREGGREERKVGRKEGGKEEGRKGGVKDEGIGVRELTVRDEYIATHHRLMPFPMCDITPHMRLKAKYPIP